MRCITDFRLLLRHKIWNCLPTLNPNNILSYRRRFMKLRILLIFYDGRWAETNAIIPINDEKLKSNVEKLSCFVQWHTSNPSIKYTEKNIEFHYYWRLTMKKWIEVNPKEAKIDSIFNSIKMLRCDNQNYHYWNNISSKKLFYCVHNIIQHPTYSRNTLL